MIVFAIVLSTIVIICSAIAVVYDLINDNFGGAVVMFLLALLNIFLFTMNVATYKAKKNGEYDTKTVTNVVGYDVDSTIVINGTDTTKTYTLTYWKDYD